MNYYFDTDAAAQVAVNKHSEDCGWCYRGYWAPIFNDEDITVYGCLYESHHDAVLCSDKFVFRKVVIP